MSDNVITLVEAQREQFGKVVSVKGIEFEREREFAMQTYEAKPNDYFRKVANANPKSLANAIVNVAAIGVSLNPAMKLAYLVPRKDAISLDISYMGLLWIAIDAGAIRWGQAVVVRKSDKFELNGIDQQPRHAYEPFASKEQRGDIVGVYCVVKTADGDYLTHTMRIEQVNDIRDRSEAYKRKSGPWISDPEEMIKKTCVKQAAKYWPRRERLDNAVHYLNSDGEEGINFVKANTMPEDEAKGWAKKIQDADTKEAAKGEWRKAQAICKDLDDVATAEKLKVVLLRHAAVLDGTDPNAVGPAPYQVEEAVAA